MAARIALGPQPRRRENARIRGKIRAYAEDPSSRARNVRRLRGSDGFLRLRGGDWRIVMRDADILEVLHIATRGHAYRD